MKIAIRSTILQQQEILEKEFAENIAVEWIKPDQKFDGIAADVYFDLSFNDADITSNELIDNKLVFAHAVNCNFNEIGKPNYVRLNAWPGFLNRPVTELACTNLETRLKAEDFFKQLNWKYICIEDDYGFVAARIIAMIINEAFFVLEQNVSTKNDIDIAMKLGTNYPFGPFEWAEKIGLQNIVNLLQQLAAKDKRYNLSKLLVQEFQQI